MRDDHYEQQQNKYEHSKDTRSLSTIGGMRDDHYQQQQNKYEYSKDTRSLYTIEGRRDVHLSQLHDRFSDSNNTRSLSTIAKHRVVHTLLPLPKLLQQYPYQSKLVHILVHVPISLFPNGRI